MIIEKESEMPVKKKPVLIENFNGIDVPLVPVRMEIAALQKDGFISMPLGDFLQMIARVIKDAKKENV